MLHRGGDLDHPASLGSASKQTLLRAFIHPNFFGVCLHRLPPRACGMARRKPFSYFSSSAEAFNESSAQQSSLRSGCGVGWCLGTFSQYKLRGGLRSSLSTSLSKCLTFGNSIGKHRGQNAPEKVFALFFSRPFSGTWIGGGVQPKHQISCSVDREFFSVVLRGLQIFVHRPQW